MKETERIQKLFEDLYNGNPWIDSTFINSLSGISAKEAAYKINPKSNSIWQIVNHLVSWRLHAVQRLQGAEEKTDSNNYFYPVSDTSETAWKKTLANLEESQKQWLVYLKQLSDDELQKSYSSREFTRYELIHGIIQHDAYHLGQIVLLSKLQSY